MTPFKKLKDVSNYCTDKILKSEITVNEYISTTNMLADMKGVELATSLPPSLKLNRYEPNDILIANIRPYFKKIWQADKTGGCDADVLNIRADKKEILPEYLYYTLFKKEFFDYIMVGAKGVKMPRGDKEFIMNFKVPIPSVQKQEAIISKIKPIFQKIESNNFLISSLEEYSQLLFHKWFVYFNFSDENGNPYKDSGGEMVDVDGKVVPKGWSLEYLNVLVDKVTLSITPQDSPNEAFKYFSIPVYDATHMCSIELGSAIGSNKYMVNSNNLLVSKLNPWFKRVVYPYNIDKAVCSTEYVVWEPKHDGILEYLYVLAKTYKFTEHNTKASSGTSNSHKRVSPEYMLKYNIKYDLDTIKCFNAKIKPIVIKIFSLYEENQLLEETRDLLIKKMIK